MIKFIQRIAIVPVLLLSVSLPSSAIELRMCPWDEPFHSEPFHRKIKPLADLLSKGEGDYNAVNRGRAGDTPQGIEGLTNKTFDQFTVQQVMDMQKKWLYAVGRYQFIPTTLKFAVKHSDVTPKDKFTPETQDKLLAALILHKRPDLGKYLMGHHDNLSVALKELAREWASVEYSNGKGLYNNVGGNRAHISKIEAGNVLKDLRQNME